MLNNEKSNSKKIIIMIVLVITLTCCITGATYAYFAIGATNNNVVTGTAASPNLSLVVTKVLPASNTNPMVPQLSVNTTTHANALKSAIDNGCVDANSNVVCHVYKITVQNTSTNAASLRLNATITLSGGTYNNLKWYTLATDNNVASVPAGTYTYPSSLTAKYGNLKEVTALGDQQQLSQNKYRYFYVAIWIEEIGEDQGANAVTTKKDQGTFIGEVKVNMVDASGNVVGGLTSTITG